jgi:electron transport complex protein RnfB
VNGPAAAAAPSRRSFLAAAARGLFALLAGGLFGAWAVRPARGRPRVWQIDPFRCVQCGRCATSCVLSPSAVKLVHAFPICGYCKLCFGFFRAEQQALNEGAENQRCPTGAIGRRLIEDPYYEYTIDESRCIGCGRCARGCTDFGNGSMYLQVRHDRCVNCNDCSIARACPARAFVRVPADDPYLPKRREPRT